MGASRKLQGEIDRVLKKVQEGVDIFDSIWNKVYDTENANQKEKYEADLKKEIKKLQRYRDQIKTWQQSSDVKDKKTLMDARKQIEKEMERFKVCEKETKTKAFSKEGLGQQPKTDPKGKAKSETRDWLNNIVGDLESQIDNFEAEIEGLTVKKGKTRPPRLVHLETSIARHKAHILKLELILRLLDNDELSPEQVNDVKEFLEDYVERNQDDFDDFSDVDDLYSSLPLDKVEALEDLVGSSGLVKAVSSVSAASSALGVKNTLTNSSYYLSPKDSSQDGEEAGAQDSSADNIPKTPPSKTLPLQSLAPAASPSVASGSQMISNSSSFSTATTSSRPLVGGPTVASLISGTANGRGVSENAAAAVSLSLMSPSVAVKEDDNANLPGHRSSPAIPEIGLGRSISGGLSNQSPLSAPMSLGSVGGISGPPAIGLVPAVADVAKRNVPIVDERVAGGGISQPLVSPLSHRVLLQQVSKANDGTVDSNNVAEGPVVGGHVFSPSPATGGQWRPQTATSFQSQLETGQVRGRPEIAPDQREKFLQRLQQVQQQGPGNLLGAPMLSVGNPKQFPSQQQSSFLQQFNSQSSSLAPQVGLGLGVQTPNLNSVASAPQQQSISIHQRPSQHTLIQSGSKDDIEHPKVEEKQQSHMQSLSDDSSLEPAVGSGFNKIVNNDDLRSPYAAAGPASFLEGTQLSRDTDLSLGQPLQPSQPSAGLGVIGRRSIADLGTIGDIGLGGNSVGLHDEAYNKQMLDTALHRLPQPSDSERTKSYVPRNPAVTPASYPQQQAPLINNPAFWERLAMDQQGPDMLFFAFYYQQNMYQQYLAAKELKRWAWRYHKTYNTWFQRHEEPKVTTDEYENGTYVYFDFHIADDNSQLGWCQRIRTDFTFEYAHLEDELVV